MKEWLEQGAGLIILGAVTGIGLLVRVLLFGYYGKLCRECRRFEKSRHRSIAYIRGDLIQRIKKGQEIKNVMTYTEYRLAECRVLGIRVGRLENLLVHSMLLLPVCGVMTAFTAQLSGCDDMTVLYLLFASGMTVLGLLVTDMVLGLRDKYRRIRFMIRDYIENNWSVRAEWPEDNLMPEKLAASAIEKTEKKIRKDRENTGSKDKPIKTAKRKKGKAQEEKRRLTEELLRERRQMEARSFAEQRKKEQVTEEEIIQVQEEAAVAVTQWANTETVTEGCEAEHNIRQEPEAKRRETGTAYEILLSEVLAEYLA